MRSTFIGFQSSRNPSLHDAERSKGEAMLQLRIQQTSDVGLARGYEREGKPFEASIIMSKYGALSQDGQFDPVSARETAQRSAAMKEVIATLVRTFPEIPNVEQALLLRNFSLAELQQLLANKDDFRFAWEDYKGRAGPNASLSSFFASPQFRVLGSKNFSYNADNALLGSPSEIAAALVNQQVGRLGTDLTGTLDANTLATNTLLQDLIKGQARLAGVAGPASASASAAAPSTPARPSASPITSTTNEGLNRVYANNMSSSAYKALDAAIKRRLTNNRQGGVPFDVSMLS